MSDGARPPGGRAGPPGASRALSTAAPEDRAAVKRKIVRKLSKLASSLLASGAIEAPAQASLEADPPRRGYRNTRKK